MIAIIGDEERIMPMVEGAKGGIQVDGGYPLPFGQLESPRRIAASRKRTLESNRDRKGHQQRAESMTRGQLMNLMRLIDFAPSFGDPGR
jgi:hypothetical protein